MPLYDYKCQSSECGHEFEKIVTKFDTEAKQECPKCGSESMFFLPTGSRNVKFLFNYLAPDA